MDDEVNGLEKYGVIGVIFVNILGHLCFVDYLEEVFVNLYQVSRLILWRREKLEELKDLDLQPGARSLVVEVVSRVSVDVSQNTDKLVDKLLESTSAHDCNHPVDE